MPIHLALKPLPIAVEEQKARSAAWDWEGVAEAPLSSDALPSVPAKEHRLSTVTAAETTTTSTSRRTSSVSDASADIAFSGPILHNPPPVLPAFAPTGASASGSDSAPPAAVEHPRRSRALSPIFEAESSTTSRCHSSAASAIVDLAALPATLHAVPTARPILHVDSTLVSARKVSAYSASVYSTGEQELAASAQQSCFSPDTPPPMEDDSSVPVHIGGLAISGAGVDSYAVSPSAPASPQLHTAPPPVTGAAPDLPQVPVAYALALANKPSFSRYRFPAASPSPSPPPSEAGRESSLLLGNDLNEDYGGIAPEEGGSGSGAPSSALTAATSTFESPLLLPNQDLKFLASTAPSPQLAIGPSRAPTPLTLSTHGSGLWRSGWTLESPTPSSPPGTRGPTPDVGDEHDATAAGVPRVMCGTASRPHSRSPSPAVVLPTRRTEAAAAAAEPPQLPPSTRSTPLPSSSQSPSPSPSVSIESRRMTSTACQTRPVSFALPREVETAEPAEDGEEEGPASPSHVFDLGTRTLSVQRKKSKVLPAIPDSDAWTGTGTGTDRIEVYCQRELVRHDRNGQTERIVLERTLLYGEGEGAPRDAVGVAV